MRIDNSLWPTNVEKRTKNNYILTYFLASGLGSATVKHMHGEQEVRY